MCIRDRVLLVSFVLQLFALVTPLFFQVVMDKVLVHRGLTTLDVIAGGLLVVVVFESALSGLRTYVFAHTTSRIDVELGARLFRHPVSYTHLDVYKRQHTTCIAVSWRLVPWH